MPKTGPACGRRTFKQACGTDSRATSD